MSVATILKQKGASVVTLDAGATFHDLAGLLAKHRIGAVVIMDRDDVVGIVSERDLVRAVVEHGEKALTMPVSREMTSEVICCGMDDSTGALMSIMTERRIRHLPVLHEGRLAGIISIGDIVKDHLAKIEMEAESMKRYIASG